MNDLANTGLNMDGLLSLDLADVIPCAVEDLQYVPYWELYRIAWLYCDNRIPDDEYMDEVLPELLYKLLVNYQQEQI